MPSPAAASRPRPIVVVADPLAPDGLALLRERFSVRVRDQIGMFADVDEVRTAKLGA